MNRFHKVTRFSWVLLVRLRIIFGINTVFHLLNLNSLLRGSLDEEFILKRGLLR